MRPLVLFDGEDIFKQDISERDRNWLLNVKDVTGKLITKKYISHGIDGYDEEASLFPCQKRAGFVGFIFIDGRQIISFPKYLRGMNLDNTEDVEQKSKLLSRALFCYQKFLSEYDSLYEQCVKDPANIYELYKRLLSNYFRHGLYKKSAVVKSKKGRIDWKDTVNRKHVSIINGIPLYFTTENRRKVFLENEVTEIQKAVLNAAARDAFVEYSKVTFVESKLSIQQILSDRKKYLNILALEKQQIFNDDDLEMVNLLIKIIEGEQVQFAARSSNKHTSIFAVADFKVLFERMVDDYFQNELSTDWSNITDKFSLRRVNEEGQTISWVLNPKEFSGPANYLAYRGRNARREWTDIIIPDTLYEDSKSDKVYIIDAKYHKYEVDARGNVKGLPGQQADIYKQYYYAEVIENYLRNVLHSNSKVRNVFILPINEKDQDNELLRPLHCSGYNKRGGEKIFLVFINTSSMMQEIFDGKSDFRKNREVLNTVINDYLTNN